MQDEQPEANNVQGNDENEPSTTWKFQPETTPAQSLHNQSNDNSPKASEVRWTASEFIEHKKSGSWYGALVGGTLVVGGLVYLVTNGEIVPTITIIIVAILFGIFAARSPRELEYVVDGSGVKIGEKMYPFSGFRSFSIVQEEGIESIWFTPLKRFMPMITIYFAPNDGQKIVDVLAAYLPMEHKKLDPVDRLMHSIRF